MQRAQKPKPMYQEPSFQEAKPDAAEEARARLHREWRRQIQDYVLAKLGTPHDLLQINVGLHRCGTKCRVDVWRCMSPSARVKAGLGLPAGEGSLLSANILSDSHFLRLASSGESLKILSVDPEIVQKY